MGSKYLLANLSANFSENYERHLSSVSLTSSQIIFNNYN